VSSSLFNPFAGTGSLAEPFRATIYSPFAEIRSLADSTFAATRSPSRLIPNSSVESLPSKK